MRPTLLDPYFMSVGRLPGIGPKLVQLFDTLTGRAPEPARLVDLLFHLPIDLVDRSLSPTIAEAPREGIATIKVVVEEHRPPPPGRAKAPHRVIVGDETGDVTLVFFRLPKQQIESMLPLGARRVISGRMELFDGQRQMVHPDRILPLAKFSEERVLEPVYPLTEGLTARRVQNAALAALEAVHALPEWQDETILKREGWPGFLEGLQSQHDPVKSVPFGPESPGYRRLAYDEMLAGQMALQLVRARERGPSGQSWQGNGAIRSRIIAALPYRLTGAQQRALAEINTDLAKPERMLRLVQGDVGAGKTIVALLAMATVVEAGAQAAMMAPTEILARQHYERLAPLAEAAGVTLVLELLNSKIDHPDYQADRTPWAAAVCERVGSPRVKVLYDIYHMQIMEGDLIRTLQTYAPLFGHYHTAGCPGRHELDETQEINYHAVLRAIKATGYQGYVVHEFLPVGDPLTSLRATVARYAPDLA